MSEYDVRLDILQIAADMGYKVNNWNGSMYIYNGKYKIYVVNAKTHRDPYSDPTISKDVEFDLPNFTADYLWLLKEDNYIKVLSGTYDKKKTALEKEIENYEVDEYGN